MENNEKLLELASKAVDINKELLKEEKELIAAVKQGKEMSLLEKLTARVNELVRKEQLFLGALRRSLEKNKGSDVPNNLSG
jgi:hypothetical protein